VGLGKHDKQIKAACNKDVGYLAAVKIITCLVLHYAFISLKLETSSSHPVKIGE